MRVVILLGVAILAAAAIFSNWPLNTKSEPEQLTYSSTSTALADVIVPEKLSSEAKIGKRAYDVKCAACHGPNGEGQKDVAPPLVHKIYEPGHHGDETFQRAAAIGVVAHHWPFGDMPPVEAVTRADVKTIIDYIRELQRANGIQ